MEIHNCIQGSSEWFTIRLGCVTASHFSEVLNKKSGYKTYMYRLLGERLSGEPYEAYSNRTMELGMETESQARAYYEALYGKVEQVGFVQLNEDVGCSPDGLVGSDGMTEFKCPYPSTHAKYIIDNRLPAAYKSQVQGQLWVTGRQWCDFVSFDPRVKKRPFWKIRVCRDEEYINTLIMAVEDFVGELVELERKVIKKNEF